MADKNFSNKRKDSSGRVLKENETQKSDGSYIYRWREDGVRRAVGATTLDELRQKEKAIRATIDKGLNVLNDNITLNNVYEIWKDVKRGLKENTFANYQYMYEHFVYPIFGRKKLKDIKRTTVRAFYNSLSENQGLGIDSIDSIHTVVHQVLDLAVLDEYLSYNPSDNALKELKRAIGNKKRRFALSREAEKAFMDYVNINPECEAWRPVFTVLDEQGLRIGEACGLQWSSVDFENRKITIRDNLVYFKSKQKGCAYALNTTKTESGIRVLPMTKNTEKQLRKLKEVRDQLGIRSSLTVDGKNDFVFLNRFGRPLNQGTVNKAIRRITKKANMELIDKGKKPIIPYFTTHVFRHTFVTRCCEARMEIKVIQYLAGHKDIKTTLDIYAEVTKEGLEEGSKEFEKYMEKFAGVTT